MDVNAAINGGRDSKDTIWRPLQDGDTLMIPAGSATWKEKLTITKKSLTIKGAGIDSTRITADRGAGPLFSIEKCGSKFVDLSEITWIGNTRSPTVRVGKDGADKNTNYRLHDLYFSVNSRGILLMGKCEGVIDHCIFRCALNSACQGVTVWGDSKYA